MKPYLFFLYSLIIIGALGCTVANNDDIDSSEIIDRSVPTVANIFSDPEIPTPLPRSTPRPAIEVVPTLPSPTIPNVKYTIFSESLNNDWSFEQSNGFDYDENSQLAAYQGHRSIELKPLEEYGEFSFTVKEGAEKRFSRDEVLALSFWLYSGEDFIANEDLLVRVVGSNAQPYWISNDNSVDLIDPSRPLFPGTRLAFLGIQNSIPAGSWINIELWLDDLLYEPEYEYVTGITILNDENYNGTFYIDNVELILKDPVAAALANPTSEENNGMENNSHLVVDIDANENVHPISPLIYGLSGGEREEGYIENVRPSLLSWGGSPNSRYNWEIGNAWNAGRDWFYSNDSYQWEDGESASDVWAEIVLENNLEGRMVVPTLGWVAKDTTSCSFPLEDGTCGDAEDANCQQGGRIANPETANVASNVDFVLEWLRHLRDDQGFSPRFLALDNEPELWGFTHYDVHPNCTTYKEVLEKYITYATALRVEFPDAELGGPVVCCWYSYWDAAPGPVSTSFSREQDYIPWFLDNLRHHDEDFGQKTIDTLDVHYYPQELNNNVDEETSAWRLRSTRSLWDPDYVSETWISEEIHFIPRMKQLIAAHYPDIQLGISEWNFGADEYMNGGLTIADVLGIYGRDEVYMAAYWHNPPLNSPGYHAFKMYTNYDNEGGGFGNVSVLAESINYDVVSSYASIDSETGNLHVILINKMPNDEVEVHINLDNYLPAQTATMYRYDEMNPTEIVAVDIDLPTDMNFSLPSYSISQLIIQPRLGE